MATATIPGHKPFPITLPGDLEQFRELPNWLVAIVQPERVRAALTRAVPEIASSQLLLLECQISRLRMKKDRWTGIYQLVVADPDGGQRRSEIQFLSPP